VSPPRRGSRSSETLHGVEPPPILVDAMLGNVCRDLRLLGFDAAFAGRASDAEVLRWCQREGRLLVTRDRELARRAEALPHVFIGQTDRTSQTVEVLWALAGTTAPSPFSRCLECNEPLQELPPEDARSLVPDHIALNRERFFACPQCRRVFWEGSHASRLRARIRRFSQALQGMSRPV